MAEGSGFREFDVKEIIEKLEKDSSSPDKRALVIYSFLATKDITNYDALCFAIEYIASLAGQLPWLADAAKDLVRKLYIMHAVRQEDLQWLNSTSLQGLKPETTPSSGT